MLAANECVAAHLEDLAVPSLYRIHENARAPPVILEFEDDRGRLRLLPRRIGNAPRPPNSDEIRPARTTAHHDRAPVGAIRTSPAPTAESRRTFPVTPQMYQKPHRQNQRHAPKSASSPTSCCAHSSRRATARRMKGHFALAAASYTHFTSPIRRYPDLVIHRIVKALLAEGADPQGTLAPAKSGAQGRPSAFAGLPGNTRGEAIAPIPESELAAIAQETSQTERRATEAERELIEWKKIKFMRDLVGEDFDAMILNATKYGLFVELDNLFVEGLVPIDSLRDDHYTYRENTREIIGSRHHRKYFMGQRVRVVLDWIDSIQKRLQFSLIGEDINYDLPKKKTKDKKKDNDKQVIPSKEGRVKANSGLAKIGRARKASSHKKRHKKKGKS
jgi:ribonuclease R